MIAIDQKARLRQLLAILVAGVLTTACSQLGDSQMAAAAKDQIMLVRDQPPSFGFQRLTAHFRAYPEMGAFVAKRGLPNFLAETGNRQSQYFILYYLKSRQAFACRTGNGSLAQLEFAGPYPITDREFRLLDGFRRDPSRTPAQW